MTRFITSYRLFLVTRTLLVLVFLTGFFPCYAGGAISKPPMPVIFIHGIASNADTWEAFGAWLQQNGWTFGGIPKVTNLSPCEVRDRVSQGPVSPGADFYRMEFTDSQNLTFAKQGRELDCIIRAVLNANPAAPKVILAAHSMGGLAARYYLQFLYHDDNVAKLMTIGTPHLGSWLADECIKRPLRCQWVDRRGWIPLDPLSIGAQSLIPGSIPLNELNDLASHPLPTGVTYFSLVGKMIVTPIIGKDGDGVVSAASQDLRNVDVAQTASLNHSTDSLFIAMGDCPEGITHLCQTTNPGVWNFFLALIRSVVASPHPIVLLGQSAPGFPSGVFASLASNLMVNNSGDVTFSAEVDTNGDGLGDVVGSFQLSNGEIRRITVPGFSGVTVIRTNNVGDLEFFNTSGGAGSTPIYLYRRSSGSVIKIADIGQSTPVGGTFLNIYGGPLNDNGDVAFRASVLFGNTAVNYIFLYKFATKTIIKVVRLGVGGDVTPVGGTFDSSALPQVLTSRGDVIFVANVNGGTSRGGLFRFSGAPPIKRVVVQGDPTPLGGTFIAAGWAVLSPSGDGPLGFQGYITGGTSSHGFFLKRDINLENPGPSDFITVAYAGQPTGILAGETFIDLSRDYLSVTRSGSVAFYAVFRRESIDYQGIFFWSNKKFTKIAVAGECTLSGGAYGGVSGPVLNDLGNLAFFVPQIISSPSCSALALLPASTDTVAPLFQSFLALLRKGWHGVTSLLLGSEAEAATSTQGIFTSVVQVNNTPIADAGLDQSVSAAAMVTLDGTGSSDPDNDPLTYSWTQIAGPFVAINGAATAIANFMAPQVQAVTTATFQLVVNDGQVDSDPAMTNITVNPPPPPPPPPDTFTLTVAPPVNGTVTGSGINCPGICSATYGNGTSVSLTATPASGFVFGGWGGDCGGQGNPCPLTMNAPKTVTATFTALPPPPPGTFTLTVSPPANGQVTGPGINCPGTCSATYSNGTSVSLTATPVSGFSFGGWGGACNSSGQVTLDADKTCTATFTATVVGPLIVSTTSPPAGEQGAAYGYALLAEGGAPPYTWSLGGGKKNKLPQGLTLTSDGILTGTPTKAKTTSFTVQVTDATYALATKNLSLQIVKGVKFKTKLGKGKVGTPYAATLQATGGISPLTFSLIGGALPPGLSLDPATGHIVGTPTTAGTFNFQVRVASSGGSSDQRSIRIKIK